MLDPELWDMRIVKWDIRFLQMARLVSSWSKDPSTQTGAVIVRPDRSVQSVGFNGFPKNMSDDPALYANRDEKYSRIVHCEINAAIHAREPVAWSTLYSWPFASCDRCCVQMLQAGIARFVWPECAPDKLERWGAAVELTKKYCNEAKVPFLEIPLAEIVDSKG